MNGCQTKRVELLRLRVLSSTFNGGDDPYFLYTDPELASWCVWNQPLPKAPLNVVICVDFHVNKLASAQLSIQRRSNHHIFTMNETMGGNPRTRVRTASAAGQAVRHQMPNTPKLLPMPSFNLKNIKEADEDAWVAKMTPMETVLEEMREEKKSGS